MNEKRLLDKGNSDLILRKNLETIPLKKLKIIRERADELKQKLMDLEEEIRRQQQYTKKYDQIMSDINNVLKNKKSIKK